MKTQIVRCLTVLALTQCATPDSLVAGQALDEPKVAESAGDESEGPLPEGADQVLAQRRIEWLNAAPPVVLTSDSVELSEDTRARVGSSTNDALLEMIGASAIDR